MKAQNKDGLSRQPSCFVFFFSSLFLFGLVCAALLLGGPSLPLLLFLVAFG